MAHTTCPECNGAGNPIGATSGGGLKYENYPCGRCHGTGVIEIEDKKDAIREPKRLKKSSNKKRKKSNGSVIFFLLVFLVIVYFAAENNNNHQAADHENETKSGEALQNSDKTANQPEETPYQLNEPSITNFSQKSVFFSSNFEGCNISTNCDMCAFLVIFMDERRYLTYAAWPDGMSFTRGKYVVEDYQIKLYSEKSYLKTCFDLDWNDCEIEENNSIDHWVVDIDHCNGEILLIDHNSSTPHHGKITNEWNYVNSAIKRMQIEGFITSS
ncbi:MAG: hypothetical protein ACNS62_14735 [Candidatus Cyclobacteriaceae bacterium M3_2C_046]